MLSQALVPESDQRIVSMSEKPSWESLAPSDDLGRLCSGNPQDFARLPQECRNTPRETSGCDS